MGYPHGLGRKPGMALKVKSAFKYLTFINACPSNDSHVHTLSSVHNEMRALRFISKIFVQEAAHCVFSMAMTVTHDKSV